jgi:hypothetical protein
MKHETVARATEMNEKGSSCKKCLYFWLQPTEFGHTASRRVWIRYMERSAMVYML